MKKILAIVPKKVDGCVYHRIEIPLHNIKGFDLTQVNQLDGLEDEILKNFELVWFNRANGLADTTKQIHRLKRLGIKYVIDIDDYWILPKDHLMYSAYKQYNATEKLIELIKNAAGVICTHSFLADKIKKLNDNVVVAHNALDLSQPQWNTKLRVMEDMTIFGWCGGVHHVGDIELMREGLAIARVNNYNLALAGYSDNEVWKLFEKWFSNDNYKNYVRLEGLDVYNYGRLYDYFTTALVPLKKNEFNSCKSELKMLEAGVKKKAVIVSEVMPYTNLINNDNCLVVKSKSDWFKKMKKIQDNKALEEDLAENLYHDVLRYYSLDKANEVRQHLFSTL